MVCPRAQAASTTCRSALCARCLCSWRGYIQRQERSIAFGDRVTFLLRGQEKSNQKRRPPRLALAGLLPGKSVSRGRAFRQGILPWRKGADIPVGSRCAACRPRLTAAQGPRVEQRAIVARTSQKSQSRAGAASWTPPSLLNFLRSVSSIPVSSTPSTRVCQMLVRFNAADVPPLEHRL